MGSAFFYVIISGFNPGFTLGILAFYFTPYTLE